MDFHSASNSAYDSANGYYSYAVDQVLRDVISALMEKTGYDYETAYDTVTSGGYSIYSTVDFDVQTELERVFEDLDSLRRGASACDAVIHTAFDHDFSHFVANCEKDRRVILALGEALAGSARPLLITRCV